MVDDGRRDLKGDEGMEVVPVVLHEKERRGTRSVFTFVSSCSTPQAPPIPSSPLQGSLHLVGSSYSYAR